MEKMNLKEAEDYKAEINSQILKIEREKRKILLDFNEKNPEKKLENFDKKIKILRKEKNLMVNRIWKIKNKDKVNEYNNRRRLKKKLTRKKLENKSSSSSSSSSSEEVLKDFLEEPLKDQVLKEEDQVSENFSEETLEEKVLALEKKVLELESQLKKISRF